MPLQLRTYLRRGRAAKGVAGMQEPTIKAIRGQGYRLCVKVGLSTD